MPKLTRVTSAVETQVSKNRGVDLRRRVRGVGEVSALHVAVTVAVAVPSFRRTPFSRIRTKDPDRDRKVGLYPIVTLEKQLLNMIGNLV